MMMDYISLAGFILSVLVAGIALGRFAEKVDRLIRKLEEEEHKDAYKNDRRQISVERLERRSFFNQSMGSSRLSVAPFV